MAELKIDVQDLHKSYGDNEVLKGIDAKFYEGDVVCIIGPSGSGKSTAAKLILRSHIRNGYQIVAVDPEGEISEMTRMYGGDVIDLGKGGEYGMVNPLEIIMDADENEIKTGLGYTVLNKTLQSLKAFMKYYAPDIEDDVLTLFSEVVQDTYARFGITFTSDFTQFTSNQFPTFSDVYVTVTSKLTSMTEKTHERDVMERLELKLRPSISGTFSYKSVELSTTIPSLSKYILHPIYLT